MKYKITIEELSPKEDGKSYSNSTEIYTQEVDTVDLPAIIKAVNKME